MTFGERLVQARKKIGLNQKQLAEKINITPTRLNYWEKDKRQPDVKMIQKLAKALNTTGDELIGIEVDHKNIITSDEIDKIKKYRALDEHGKKIVDFNLDEEYKRITEKNHIIRIASRNGEYQELSVTESEFEQMKKADEALEDAPDDL